MIKAEISEEVNKPQPKSLCCDLCLWIKTPSLSCCLSLYSWPCGSLSLHPGSCLTLQRQKWHTEQRGRAGFPLWAKALLVSHNHASPQFPFPAWVSPHHSMEDFLPFKCRENAEGPRDGDGAFALPIGLIVLPEHPSRWHLCISTAAKPASLGSAWINCGPREQWRGPSPLNRFFFGIQGMSVLPLLLECIVWIWNSSWTRLVGLSALGIHQVLSLLRGLLSGEDCFLCSCLVSSCWSQGSPGIFCSAVDSKGCVRIPAWTTSPFILCCHCFTSSLSPSLSSWFWLYVAAQYSRVSPHTIRFSDASSATSADETGVSWTVLTFFLYLKWAVIPNTIYMSFLAKCSHNAFV